MWSDLPFREHATFATTQLDQVCVPPGASGTPLPVSVVYVTPAAKPPASCDPTYGPKSVHGRYLHKQSISDTAGLKFAP